MQKDPPVSFAEKAKEAGNKAGYPLQLSGTDLDRCFVHAALQADESWLEDVAGKNGHSARKLKLPELPSDGTYVLGCIDGSLIWIETEECD